MKIEDFLTEQWMNDYETRAVYNLTDTSCKALSWPQLYELAKPLLQDVKLDYGAIPGDAALRKEILSLYQDDKQETLTLCNGALNGNELVMNLLLNPGDHVITIAPGYQQYVTLPERLGCSVTQIPLDEKDWSFSLEDAEKAIQPNTRLFVFANPSNPTGTWLNKEKLEGLAELCRKHDLWILCDEVYRIPSRQAASIADLYEKGIVTSSLSKLFGLAGLRLGWIKGNPQLIHDINVYRDYSFISTGPLIDRLALAALQNKEQLIRKAGKTIRENRKIISEWLESSKEFDLVLPEHGTVCFLHYHRDADSKTLAKDLLEKEGIFFVPGSCFGKEGYLRLGLGQEHEDLASVLGRLEAFMARYPEHQ